MTMLTRCTHCDAVFRVTLLQLQSSSGRVRCGVCHEVFDAFLHLRAAGADARDPAPAADAETVDMYAAARTPGAIEKTEELPVSALEDEAAAAPPADAEPAILAEPEAPPESEGPVAIETASGAAGPEAAPAVPIAEAPEAAVPPLSSPALAARRRAGGWVAATAAVCLALLLGLQGLFFFRTAIAATAPATRPLFEQACRLVGCDLPLPKLPDRLVIETSDLKAPDPGRPGRVILSTTLRNTAAVAQDYPMLELTLTDARDRVTARKVFSPREYLDGPGGIAAGLAPDTELAVRLQLDLSDIEASGYRLYLFHR